MSEVKQSATQEIIALLEQALVAKETPAAPVPDRIRREQDKYDYNPPGYDPDEPTDDEPYFPDDEDDEADGATDHEIADAYLDEIEAAYKADLAETDEDLEDLMVPVELPPTPMIVSVLQENMKKALDLVAPFVARPAPLPVLANVLLEAEDSRLKISATDLESSISVWIGARREQPGAITINAKTIKDYIGILSPEPVDFRTDPSVWTMHVRCGVHMQLEKGILTLAGADGYHLGVERLPVDYDGEEKHLTLPGDTVKKLLRVLRGHKDMEVGITLPSERNSVTFTLPNIQISTQLLEGRFPDFARIIPRSPISQVVMYAADMKVALQRAKIFAKDNANSCCLKVVPARNPGEPPEVVIGARSPEQGDTESMLDATATGDRFEWSANYKYLLEAVDTYRKDAERIVIDTNGPENPAVIRPEYRPIPSISDSSSLTVIMPMAK